MAGGRPDRIETEHIHGLYSCARQGWDFVVVCGSCGERGTSFVHDWAAPRPGGAMPEGWDQERQRGPGGRMLLIPRCPGCIEKAADALADELLSLI